ncbi:hypothetical protein PanWU01x14_231330 [Parasponia andersonii]|uniref:Uncharacterized protein n=1 Tax=Parasponia andersonii TaxID=3476 RepID=A0A2P5BKF0_PARAD|nr:hypothetical protein PanWU01x14_231330 [Parasponia andersonii]
MFHFRDALNDFGLREQLQKISVRGRRKCRGRRLFRYEPKWQADAECADIVSAASDFNAFNGTPESFISCLSCCATELSTWSRRKFGNLRKKTTESWTVFSSSTNITGSNVVELTG